MKYQFKLILRLLIILTFPISLFYKLFTPLTIYPVYFFFKIINYQPELIKDFMIIKEVPLMFIPACIAASAYYLLLILILLTKDIKLKTRIKMFILGSFMILTANIIRIIILILILIHLGVNWFETVHLFFWRLIASLVVAIVWIILIKKYKIKSIPIYSDFKYLLDRSVFKKKSLNKNKHKILKR